jgi:hypothetical protein
VYAFAPEKLCGRIKQTRHDLDLEADMTNVGALSSASKQLAGQRKHTQLSTTMHGSSKCQLRDVLCSGWLALSWQNLATHNQNL